MNIPVMNHSVLSYLLAGIPKNTDTIQTKWIYLRAMHLPSSQQSNYSPQPTSERRRLASCSIIFHLLPLRPSVLWIDGSNSFNVSAIFTFNNFWQMALTSTQIWYNLDAKSPKAKTDNSTYLSLTFVYIEQV